MPLMPPKKSRGNRMIWPNSIKCAEIWLSLKRSQSHNINYNAAKEHAFNTTPSRNFRHCSSIYIRFTKICLKTLNIDGQLFTEHLILQSTPLKHKSDCGIFHAAKNVNTSLVAKGAFTHCLQRRTACNAAPHSTPHCLLNLKLPTVSGNKSNPRLLDQSPWTTFAK